MEAGGTSEERANARARHVPNIAPIFRNRDFRTAFATASGRVESHTIVVALPDDPMSYVFGRLADADNAAVLVCPKDGQYLVAMLWPASAARVEVAREDDRVSPVNDLSDVGMFFTYLTTVRTAVISRVTAQIFDSAEVLQPACG